MRAADAIRGALRDELASLLRDMQNWAEERPGEDIYGSVMLSQLRFTSTEMARACKEVAEELAN